MKCGMNGAAIMEQFLRANEWNAAANQHRARRSLFRRCYRRAALNVMPTTIWMVLDLDRSVSLSVFVCVECHSAHDFHSAQSLHLLFTQHVLLAMFGWYVYACSLNAYFAEFSKISQIFPLFFCCEFDHLQIAHHSFWHHPQEYEEGQSPESRFVKDLDRLDLVLQAFEYEKRDNCPSAHQEFFDSNEGKFNHPMVVDLVNEIKAQRAVTIAANGSDTPAATVTDSASTNGSGPPPSSWCSRRARRTPANGPAAGPPLPFNVRAFA